jgi:outer membrane protein
MIKLSPFRGLLVLNFVAGAMALGSVTSFAQDTEVATNLKPAQVASLTEQHLSEIRATFYTPSNLNRVGVQTAQPIPLTLDEAIRRSLQNNNDIEISRDDVRFQETQVRSLQGIYDPVFTVAPTFTHNSSTGSTATKDFRVNAGVDKFFERGGGNIQSFFNNSRTENAFAQAQVTSGSVQSGPGAIYSSDLGVRYTQPLFRNFRIDSRRQAVRVAKKRLEQTDTDFRLQATTTITNTQRAYWDFVFSLRNQQNQVANVNFAKENLRQIEAKIDAGSAAPLERAEVATELANREGDLLLATQQVSIAENTLKQLVIREPLSQEWTQTFVPTDRPAFTLQPASLDEAMKDAMDNRFELRRLKLQQDINKVDLEYFKNQTKPQIDLNATFSLTGLSRGGTNQAITAPLVQTGSDIFLLNAINDTRIFHGQTAITSTSVTIPPSASFLFGGFNRSLANIFRSDAPNYSIGVTISFPFRNRTAKANLEGAKIQEHQIETQLRGQEQIVIVEVRNAVQAVETSRQRVLTARRARESAEIQLEGERKLYESGRSTTFLLFQRENALTNARNAEIRAETDYNKAVADLQRSTSTAFRANNITIDSPVVIK